MKIRKSIMRENDREVRLGTSTLNNNLFAILFGVIFLLAAFIPNAEAQTCSWMGGSGNWRDAANWSCGHAPGSTDDVFITSDGALSLTLTGDFTNSGTVNIQGDLIWGGEGCKNFNNTGTVDIQSGSLRLECDHVAQQGALKAPGGVIAIESQSAYFGGGVTSVADPDETGGSIRVITEKAIDSVAGHTFDASGKEGGSIYLDAGDNGRIFSSATFKAEGLDGKGGIIEMTGGVMGLLNARVSVDGTEGGVIHIGGGWQGSGSLRYAKEIFVSAPTLFSAKGSNGRGGEIVVWSAEFTDFYGRAEAGGIPDANSGGKIEISSKDRLTYNGTVNAGVGGEALFDPKNITITESISDSLAWVKKLAHNKGASANMPSLSSGYGNFGKSIALDGDRLAVGALDSTGGGNRGAVHLFTGVGTDFSGLTWQKKLATGTGATNMPALVNFDYFGESVALDGDMLAVGAAYDDTGGDGRGAVHLFTGVGTDFSGLTWQKKLASGTGATNMPALADSDLFGKSVALDGDRLAVGAAYDDTGGNGRGAVHLFTGVGTDFSGLTWQKKLASGTGATNMPALVDADLFGASVALDGDRLAVGAYGDDTGGDGRGAVHLFTGVGTDFSGLTWQKKLASGTGATSMPLLADQDLFGISVALDADRLAVGVQGDDTNRGAVHLFTGVGTDFSGLTWQKKLASGTGATNTPALAEDDYFGTSVALDGDRLAVGAIGDDTGGTTLGAVHLFTGVGTDFSGLTYKKKVASGLSLADSDWFGRFVALDGDKLAVGADGDDTGGATRGAVHLFTGVGTDFSGLTWQKKLASGTGATSMPTLVNGDLFGAYLALDGDRLAVGAYGDDTGGTYRGAVHLFTGVGTDFSGLLWQKKLATGTGATSMPALADQDRFGASIALDGDRLAVGAYVDDVGGAVHLFTGVGSDFSGLLWQKKLATGTGATSMPALAPEDWFGASIALDGDRLAVGAYGDDTGGTYRGAVHLFTGVGTDFSGLVWQKKLATGTGATSMPVLVNDDYFGASIALDGDRLAVGAYGDDTGGADRGAVHLFTGVGTDFSGLVWQKKLASGQGATTMPALVNDGRFGYSVALDGDRLAVGAYGDDTGGADRGAVHLFTGMSTLGGISDSVVSATFATNSGTASTITSSSITTLLNAGTAVTLQANNDITISSAVTANNPSGNGGDLTLQAGRSILLNADITTDNGDLDLYANASLASGVVDAQRDNGNALITMASTTSINAGSGNVTIEMKNGDGKTYTSTGAVSLESITAASLTVARGGGSDITINTAYNNTGSLNVKGGTLSLLGAFTQSGSVEVASGAILRKTGGFTNAGVLRGAGTIDVGAGNTLTNNGEISPGTSSGALNVIGNLTKASTSVMNIELGGTTAGTQYDQLLVTGSAALSGTLNVSLLGGFDPAIGNSFTIQTATSSMSGAFSTVNLPALTGGKYWNAVAYNTASIALSVASSPVNGSCGTSNGQTLTAAPSSNLCSAGAASLISGIGPWTWTCDGQYGGTGASCTADIRKYTVSTSSGAGGGISPNTPQTVPYGTIVSFTVTPDTGYGISSITGCSGSPSGSIYVTGAIISDCTVTAAFTPNQYALTIGKSGMGNGTVTGAGTYGPGVTVTATASADAGSVFAGWAGCDSSAGKQCTATMNSDRSVIAVFSLDTWPGNALYFDGTDDYAECESGTGLNITDVITLEAWIKHNTGNFAGAEDIVTKGNSYGLRTESGTGNIVFYMTSSGGLKSLSSNVKPVSGQWYHIVGTYDGKEQKIYINGALKNKQQWSGLIDTDTSPFIFGHTAAAGGGFNGVLDEVRVWHTVRTESEIQAHMRGSLTGSESGLSGYWRLDEGAGDTAFDMTANGSYCTLGRGSALSEPAWVASDNYKAEPVKYTLNVSKTGSGSLSFSPPGTSCGTDCFTYNKNQRVTISARAAEHNMFSGWSGGCSGTGKCSVVMGADINIASNFVATAPVISIAPAGPKDFGTIRVGRLKTKTLKITNNGIGNLRITSLEIDGADSDMFSKRSGTTIIKPGKSSTLRVMFKPWSRGIKSANLRIKSNDPDNAEVNIQLNGTGK